MADCSQALREEQVQTEVFSPKHKVKHRANASPSAIVSPSFDSSPCYISLPFVPWVVTSTLDL